MYVVETATAKSGDPILKVNNYYLHSRYNPQKEAQQLVQNQFTPHLGYVLFGYGSGYVVDALLQSLKNDEKLIVIDPLVSQGQVTIKEEHQHIDILDGLSEEELAIAIYALSDHVRWSLKVICSPNYDKLFQQEYLSLLQMVKTIQYRTIINDATTVRYEKDWHINVMNNLVNLQRDTNIVHLKGAFHQPVIVISGGPSLTKQIVQLKQIKDHAILIAAGSTINTLIQSGVEPHFVVTIDGGDPNYRHFKNVSLKNAKIIYALQNHYKVRDSFHSTGYYVGSTGYEEINKYVERNSNQTIPILNGGGSVAHLAFSIAQYISTGPIALIGQDLAYTDNLTHAKNNINCRVIDDEFIKKKRMYKIKEYFGGEVYTTKVLDSMRIDFEEIIKVDYPKVPFYNCTEGGAFIEGYTNLSFRDFCSKYIRESDIVKIPSIEIDSKNEFEVEPFLKKEIKVYENIIQLLNESIFQLKTNRSNVAFEPRVLKRLEELDKKVDSELKKVLLDLLAASLKISLMKNYLEKENETPSEAYERVYNQSYTLYSELKKIAEFAKQCNEDIIERMRGNSNE